MLTAHPARPPSVPLPQLPGPVAQDLLPLVICFLAAVLVLG